MNVLRPQRVELIHKHIEPFSQVQSAGILLAQFKQQIVDLLKAILEPISQILLLLQIG